VAQKIENMNFSYQAGELFQNNPYLLPQLINFVIRAVVGPKYLIDVDRGV
jgi:hypothetical protein